MSGGHAMSHMALAYRCVPCVRLNIKIATDSCVFNTSTHTVCVCVWEGQVLSECDRGVTGSVRRGVRRKRVRWTGCWLICLFVVSLSKGDRSSVLVLTPAVAATAAVTHPHLHPHCPRCKQAVVLLLSTAVFSVTHSLEAEPLLACVTAGMLLANKR